MENSSANSNTQNQKPASDNNAKQDKAGSEVSSQQHEKLDAAILKTWNKLSAQEIASRKANPDQFFATIKTKYSIEKADAEKTLEKLKTECGIASGTGSDSKPTTKVA